jgi:hypothetical protein
MREASELKSGTLREAVFTTASSLQGFHKVEIPEFPHPRLSPSGRQIFDPGPKAGEKEIWGAHRRACPSVSTPNPILVKALE